MSCNCESCKAYDDERAKSLEALGAWLVGRKGKNGATTSSILRRKLIKIGVIDPDREPWESTI